MKKTVKKKLSLMRETLGRLDDLSLSVAAGGSRQSLTEPTCGGTCFTECTVCASCHGGC